MQSNNSESLLSELSNVSYREPKKMYSGSQFFRESLPPGHDGNKARNQMNSQQVDIEALGNSSAFKLYQGSKDHVKFDTIYWASDHNIEGTSDNEEMPILKIEEEPEKQIKLSLKEQQLVRPDQDYHQKHEADNFENEGVSDDAHGSSSVSGKNGNRIKNETKNIPKNFGKAIIIFIEKNPELLSEILEMHGVNHQSLMGRLKNLKKKINTIADLRNLWSSEPESKCLRIISNLFLRKHSLHYIYNSRIKTRLCHSKYKRRLQQAIVDPFEFNHIKDY